MSWLVAEFMFPWKMNATTFTSEITKDISRGSNIPGGLPEESASDV